MTRSFETGSSERYGIAASIEHANVVGIHYTGEHQGVLLVVMDFVYATELQHLLEELGLGALQADRAVDLLMQFASALDAAHAGSRAQRHQAGKHARHRERRPRA